MLCGSSDWGISIHSCFSLQGSEGTIAAMILHLYSTWYWLSAVKINFIVQFKDSLKSPLSKLVWCDSANRIVGKMGLP